MMNGMGKNNISYNIIENTPGSKELNRLENLYSLIFEDAQIDFFHQRLKENKNLCSIVAFDNEKPIGFKIGYKYNNHTFYSWVGGVLPKYRNQGIAQNLAHLQEKWAKENSYLKLRTKSMNKFKPMMILNLKRGFNIVSIYTNSSNQNKIVFEKKLI